MTERPNSVVVGYFFNEPPADAVDAKCWRCKGDIKISKESVQVLGQLKTEGKIPATVCFICSIVMAKEDTENGIPTESVHVRDYLNPELEERLAARQAAEKLVKEVPHTDAKANNIRDSLVIGIGVPEGTHGPNCACVPVSCMECGRRTYFSPDVWANMQELMTHSIERNIEVQTLCHVCGPLTKGIEGYTTSQEMFGD